MAKKYIQEVDAVTRQMFPHYPDAEQITEFYCALGVGISTWQLVESTLYLVYERATLPRLPGAASSAFHALQHTQSKLNATDAAVQFALLQERDETKRAALSREWKTIRSKVGRRLERRNHLAHFEVNTYVQEPKREDKIRLRPMSFDFRFAVGIRQPIEYRINDIYGIVGSFRRINARLHQFLAKIPQPAARP